MPRTERPRILLIESLKILLVLGGFFLLQNQILGVRYDIYGHRAGVASAEARRGAELGQVEEKVDGTLKDCAFELSRARGELEQAIVRFDDRREDLLRLIDDRTRAMEGSIIDRLESEKQDIDSTRFALEAGTARLERLSVGIPRDTREMKRRMIHPTVQLKGNGTVGSGVLVYSEPQPELEVPPGKVHATFVLTAYHVVLEVMGDHAEAGIVGEIHVSAGTESAAMEVFSAKLVLFDRAHDVAILRLNSTRKFVDVAELMPLEDLEALDVFARAYAVGCPLGNRPLPTIGEISSKSKLVADQVFWMLSAPTFFGNSGGGVYLAENFQLIGVSSMIYTYGKANPTVVPHMGLFVPLETIYRWLDLEGYSFLHGRRAIPKGMLWKLAYVEKDAPVPCTAAGQEKDG